MACEVNEQNHIFTKFIFIPLVLGQEKKLVEEVFNNAIDCLSDEDKTLPQVRMSSVFSVFHECLAFPLKLLRPSVGDSYWTNV